MTRVLGAAVLLCLMVISLQPAPGVAACRPDDDACLEQEGDNDTDVDVDTEGEGGDAIAGSQVISVTGGGNTNITANNSSRFARARGGDVESNVEVDVDNGPDVRVAEPSSEASSTSAGSAVTVQTADPDVSVRLDQTAFPTGDSFLTNTGQATGFAAGESVLSPSLGTGASSVGSNAAFVTGSAPVTQVATSMATPTAIASGRSAAATAVGLAGVVQDARPTVSIELRQFALPSGSSIVSNGGTTSAATLNANNVTTGAVAPVTQNIAQTSNTTATSSLTPVVNVTAANASSIVGTAPVTQAATAVTLPVATAGALGPNGVSGRLFQDGDNEVGVDISGELAGGDGVAGSNVIAAAGTGDTTISADNSSGFAVSDGGDVESFTGTEVASGPSLFVDGSTAGATFADTATTLNAAGLAAALGGPLPFGTATGGLP